MENENNIISSYEEDNNECTKEFHEETNKEECPF